MSRLGFTIESQAAGSAARAGRFRTLHNEVLTPLFMPVGTHATVRAQRQEFLLETGSQILLANTYHLMLRPGVEVFKKFQGIHGFMNWPRSVLTDSGGFQIFCMPNSRKMEEQGATFQSYVDGEKILLTPERSIATQMAINSDIMMVLDQCISSTAVHKEAETAMELTYRWAKRSLAARGDSPQSMFGIVQGACYPDLRKRSAEQICSLPLDGFALGGLAVGETKAEREDTTEFAAALLPKDKPRYLMGVGTPIDLLEAVHRGIDMFDCILPTAMAQQGVIFTAQGKKSLRRSKYKFSQEPIDPQCGCQTCQRFTQAYLHHLTKTKEQYGWQLLGEHNIYFYHQLMREMRESILAGTFADYYRNARDRLAATDSDGENPPPKPVKTELPSRGNFTVVKGESYYAIQHISSGEIMHSVNDPATEARELYVEQSQIIARALASPSEAIKVWDVGLGAGFNAMSLLAAYEVQAAKGMPIAPLEILSFENDCDAFHLALKHPQLFPHTRHPAPHALAARGEWQSKKYAISWRLFHGDFLAMAKDATAPDIVFYDPFSYKTNSDLWSLPCFMELRKLWGEKAVSLFTYSNSTAIRATMLAAGFFVAKGRSTGPKADTTVAFSPAAKQAGMAAFSLLDGDWLKRWERSDARMPYGVGPDLDWEKAIYQHQQFVLAGSKNS